MRGLWNWFKKSRSFECGFSSGRLLAPYCLRRSFAISSERPCSELASLSYVFSNEYECHICAIVWIVSEFAYLSILSERDKSLYIDCNCDFSRVTQTPRPCRSVQSCRVGLTSWKPGTHCSLPCRAP